MSNLPVIAAIIFATLSVAFLIGGIAAIKRRRLFGSTVGILMTLLMLSLSALCATITIATHGYRALTREEIAATVKIEPLGQERFMAHFSFPGGEQQSFRLAGEELYVDAHILKWRPLTNFLGLHTTYELDRVAGRYIAIDDEREKMRTVFALSRDKPVNMFDLRTRYAFFKPLLDAEYGSATFITVDRPAEFEVRVSTTGLLIRQIEP